MNLNQNAVQSQGTPLEQAIISLEARLDNLFNGIHELFSRLEPVLSQTPNKPNSPPTNLQIGLSPVVDRLHQCNNRIEIIVEEVATVRARLEV